MTTRRVDLGNIAELPRRYMVAKILEKRDDVQKDSKRQMLRSLSVWHSTSPKRTGRMKNLMGVRSDKYSSALVPRDSYIMVVNAINKRGKSKGFVDKFKRNQGKSFLSKW